ncbi:MAG: DUF481 domain-containing protein [Proteobacteria bacterium]|nr:DUF481 domain-containing protein [Pseudomonadota bacterium]
MSLSQFLRIALLLVCGFCTSAWSHDKTDIITLYNGDKLTGEFQSLYGGVVSFNTDALGLVKIEWKHVSRFESIYHYDIRLSDGTRYYAGIDETAIAGQIKVSSYDKQHSIEMLDIVELRAVEESWIDRIEIYLSAGYSYNKASSVAQTTLNTDISYEDENTLNALTGRTTLTDTDTGTTNSTKWDLSRTVWTDRSQLFRTFYGRFETNDELALDSRYTGGAGLGRYFIDTQKLRWTGTAGLQVLTEQSTGGDRQESVEAFMSTSFAAWKFDTPELDLELKFNLYPSLSKTKRVRADTDIRIRWELVKDLFWDVTAFGTYDNKSGETEHEIDYGITTGIGWQY